MTTTHGIAEKFEGFAEKLEKASWHTRMQWFAIGIMTVAVIALIGGVIGAW